MPNIKRITHDWSETGITAYCIIRREADKYRLNDADGSFATDPADEYLSLIEDSIIKGRYEVEESRTAWNNGRYTVIIYKQIGGSPSPSGDIAIGSGEVIIENDIDVLLKIIPTLAEIEASSILAKQTKIDFIEKWILNKLKENPAGTWTLYDTDDVTPLKVWTWDSQTTTRSKAT